MTSAAVTETLKARYILRLKDAAADLKRYIVACEAGGEDAMPAEIATLAHKLSGSGYTLGYPAISKAAAGFEAILEWAPPFAPSSAASAYKLVLACEAAIAASHEAVPPPAAPIEPPPMAQADIIVIHDDPAVALLLAALERPVVEAGSCEEALQLLARGSARLLIADLDRCKSEGFGALYAGARQAHVPVMALTSSRRLTALAHVLSDGQATCLSKPADPSDFAAQVRGLLQEQGRSVILADDDEIVREFLKTRFEAHGFRVIPAGDGEQVIAQARRQRPSIIVLDRAMPKMEGLAVLRMLKSDPATHDVPVVMLTQKCRPDQVSEGIQEGASAYMAKPFSPDAVVAKCKEILSAPRLRGPVREKT